MLRLTKVRPTTSRTLSTKDLPTFRLRSLVHGVRRIGRRCRLRFEMLAASIWQRPTLAPMAAGSRLSARPSQAISAGELEYPSKALRTRWPSIRTKSLPELFASSGRAPGSDYRDEEYGRRGRILIMLRQCTGTRGGSTHDPPPACKSTGSVHRFHFDSFGSLDCRPGNRERAVRQEEV
jgi:hypothetical protein